MSGLGFWLMVLAAAVAVSSDDVSPLRSGEPAPEPQFRPEPVEVEGIENLYRLAPNLYSGGEPRGDAAFDALARLGVRTILSVDGAVPDVEAARRYGLRYVHLPIGYDGLTRAQAVRLVRAMTTLPGPILVHCHHGKHRGPAAAAVCGMAVAGWTQEHAGQWLQQAGTAPQYVGLYDSVARFTPPGPAELAADRADLPERAPVPPLVGAMVQADRHWEHLTDIRAAGFATPADQPDLDPPHEARLLRELWREAARRPDSAARGAGFLHALADAERSAAALESALRTAPTQAEGAYRQVARSCTTCHAQFRDAARLDP